MYVFFRFFLFFCSLIPVIQAVVSSGCIFLDQKPLFLWSSYLDFFIFYLTRLHILNCLTFFIIFYTDFFSLYNISFQYEFFCIFCVSLYNFVCLFVIYCFIWLFKIFYYIWASCCCFFTTFIYLIFLVSVNKYIFFNFFFVLRKW